jgi:hypothetical protein
VSAARIVAYSSTRGTERDRSRGHQGPGRWVIAIAPFGDDSWAHVVAIGVTTTHGARTLGTYIASP